MRVLKRKNFNENNKSKNNIVTDKNEIDHNPLVKDQDIKALNKAENDLLEARNNCSNGSSMAGFLQNLSYFVRYYRTMCAEGSDSGDFETVKIMADQTLEKLRDYLDNNLIKSVTMEK